MLKGKGGTNRNKLFAPSLVSEGRSEGQMGWPPAGQAGPGSCACPPALLEAGRQARLSTCANLVLHRCISGSTLHGHPSPGVAGGRGDADALLQCPLQAALFMATGAHPPGPSLCLAVPWAPRATHRHQSQLPLPGPSQNPGEERNSYK